jgi:hypothetical protein
MRRHSPQVGIFYVIGVDFYIESFPMSEGEDWGDFKTYPNGRMEYWSVLTKQLKLSSCLSYDFYPRGRVSYAKVQDKYMLSRSMSRQEPTNDPIDQEGTVLTQGAGRAVDG